MIECLYHCGRYNDELELLICRPTKELTEDKMNDIAICRECIQKAGLVQVNRFHDLTSITSVNLHFEEVQRICDAETRLRKTASPIKACYLVPNPLLFGTIRMYQSLIERSGVSVHVSYDLEELANILKTVRETEAAGLI